MPGRRAWAAVLGLAIALRVAWATAVPVVPVSDSLAYDAFATTLATSGVYGWTPDRPTAFWPPGTSFVYALFYGAFGHSYVPIVALNVALGVAIVALTLRLATRWFGPSVGLVAAALVAAWPSLVEFTTVLGSELPFTALVLAAAWIWFRDDGITLRRAVLTGALLAAATYVRTTAGLLPVVFGAIAAIRARRWAPVGWAGVVALVMGASIAPWTMRNARVFHRVVLVATNGGTNAWMGNNPATTGEFMAPPYPPGMNEAESNEHFAGLARRYILDHPFRFVGRTALKLVRLHERESIGITWNTGGLAAIGARGVFALKLASNLYWWAALALSIAGIAGLARRERWRAVTHPAIAIWGYLAALHAVTVIQDRYHLAAIPLVAALAATVIADRTARGRQARLQT